MEKTFVENIEKTIDQLVNEASKPKELYVIFTEEEWKYIEENLEPFLPGVKRITLPKVWEEE